MSALNVGRDSDYRRNLPFAVWGKMYKGAAWGLQVFQLLDIRAHYSLEGSGERITTCFASLPGSSGSLLCPNSYHN